MTVVVVLKLPDVPVIVTAVGPPVVALLAAVKVNVLVLVAGLGLNEEVTPLGNVEVTARFTLPLNPPDGVTVMALVPLLPCATLTLPGLDESVKPGVPPLPVFPDSVAASTIEKFVLSVFARAMLCTVLVESSV